MDFLNESDQLNGFPSSNANRALRWKRILDVFLITLALPFLVPLALLVALLICVSSPGPGIFMQERVGFWGKCFKCFKFRTLYVDADTAMHQGHLLQPVQSNMPMQNLFKRQ